MIQPLVVHISRLLGLSSVPSRFSREQQRQASQHLLQLLYPHSTLAHSAEGAPQLRGSQIQLSLSHSGDYLALLTAPPQWRVGIDLETDFSRPLRLAARFLSQEELSLLSALPPLQQSHYALAAWCAQSHPQRLCGLSPALHPLSLSSSPRYFLPSLGQGAAPNTPSLLSASGVFARLLRPIQRGILSLV